MIPFMIIGALCGFGVAMVDKEDDLLATIGYMAIPITASVMIKFSAVGQFFWTVVLIWTVFIGLACVFGWGLGLAVVNYLERKSR